MLERVLRLLVCPLCHGSLDREFPERRSGGRIRAAELRCRACQATFSVQEGVGLFAEPTSRGTEWRPDPGLLREGPDEPFWQAYLASIPPEVVRAYDRATEAIAQAAVAVSGLVVDLATCRGHVLRPAAARSGTQQLLLGTDPELPRLYATQAALKRERRYTNVSLIGMDGTRWPLRDASVQGAISFYGPSILPSGRRLLGEVGRALRPGAPFVFATLLTGERTLTLRQAARKGTAELLTDRRLRAELRRQGLVLESWEVLAQGPAWRHSPYDPIPLEGDPWQHVLVRTHRALPSRGGAAT